MGSANNTRGGGNEEGRAETIFRRRWMALVSVTERSKVGKLARDKGRERRAVTEHGQRMMGKADEARWGEMERVERVSERRWTRRNELVTFGGGLIVKAGYAG